MTPRTLARHQYARAIAEHLRDVAARAAAVGAWRWCGELLRIARAVDAGIGRRRV